MPACPPKKTSKFKNIALQTCYRHSPAIFESVWPSWLSVTSTQESWVRMYRVTLSVPSSRRSSPTAAKGLINTVRNLQDPYVNRSHKRGLKSILSLLRYWGIETVRQSIQCRLVWGLNQARIIKGTHVTVSCSIGVKERNIWWLSTSLAVARIGPR